MSDERATQIGRYLKRGLASDDAIRRLAYLIEDLESKGELEVFISEEIDKA